MLCLRRGRGSTQPGAKGDGQSCRVADEDGAFPEKGPKGTEHQDGEPCQQRARRSEGFPQALYDRQDGRCPAHQHDARAFGSKQEAGCGAEAPRMHMQEAAKL